MKKIIFLLLLFFLILSSSSESQEKAKESILLTRQGSIVFLDTSMSMRGYFKTSNEPATTIQRFLRADIHNILGINNLSPIFLSRFNETVTLSEQEQINIGKTFIFKSITDIQNVFSGANTDIIKVFNNEKFSEYSVSIIITDGVQSDPGGLFNIGKMIHTVKSKIDEGMHIYLIGIKSEFNGYVYPEYPNEMGLKPPLRYKGIRPIYIWVVTYDEEKGKKLTNSIVSKLDDISEENRVRYISLTDLQLPHFNDIEIVPDKQKYMVMPQDNRLIKLKLSNHLKDNDYVDIPMRIADNPNPDGMADNLWKLSIKSGSQWADTNETDDGWILTLEYRLIPNAGFIFGRRNNYLKIKVIVLPNIEQWWWRKWNTDNDSDIKDAGKTIYLGKMGEQIIEPMYLNKKYELKPIDLKVVK